MPTTRCAKWAPFSASATPVSGTRSKKRATRVKKNIAYRERDELDRWFFARELERLMLTRPVYFMDESGIDHRLYRREAWALRGEVVTARVSGSRRGRTSVIGAWHQGSFLAPMVLEGSCDRHVMDAYFRDILLPELSSGSVVVLDNASFHHASGAEALARKKGVELLYLPSYSPDFNPIEHFWSRLKTYLSGLLQDAKDVFQIVCEACNHFCKKCTNVK